MGKNEVEWKAWKAKTKRTEIPALDEGRNYTEAPASDEGGSIYTDRNFGIRQRPKLYRTETSALDEVSSYTYRNSDIRRSQQLYI